jgi:tripartite-type tricarboxylate transporter receptor subunit TctC
MKAGDVMRCGSAARTALRGGIAALVWLATMTAIVPATAQADDAAGYPKCPVRVIVPWPAGGVSDIGTRRIATVMEKWLGVRLVVENRPGASGQLAVETVARAAPDGYTILAGDVATHGINACVFDKLNADPVKDFAPISLRIRGPMVLVVSASSPYRSVDDLVKASRAAADPIPYASSGLGTLQHLQMELFADATGAKLRPVIYKGEAPAITEVVGGQLPVMFAFPAVALPHIQSGRLRALAVTATKRIPVLPDAPTFGALGHPSLEVYSWGAFFAPKGTPRPIVDKIAAAVARANQDPVMRSYAASFGADPASSTPDELGAWVKHEIDRLCVITKKAGIRLE